MCNNADTGGVALNLAESFVMCGRYVLRTATPEIAAILGAEPPAEEFKPRYNIAPTVRVPALCTDSAGDRELRGFRWGLVPFWAKDTKIGASMVNARAETIATKPAFRAAFKRRRCVIPADGYYEWRKQASHKQPFYITGRDQQPLWFAGVWERWDKEGIPIESCSIVTTEANTDVAAIHHRMPVMLGLDEVDNWINGGDNEAKSLLKRPAPRQLGAIAVSTFVNNSRNEGERCITPLTDS